MITTEQKHQIGRLVELEFTRLGSWKKVASRLKVGAITARYNLTDPEKWYNVSEEMWVKVAGMLGYKFSDFGWELVPTRNSQIMFAYLERAQNEQVFMAVSHPAGHGKSAGVMMYRHQKQGVYYISVEESWSQKQFLVKIAEMLGLSVMRYSAASLTDAIVHEFRQKAAVSRPLLIVDEANKLKPSGLRFFIPLFNHLQDEIGVVLIGAHDLKQHIRNGVRRDARGFDELESRLGRSYMPLDNICEDDVRNICAANGLTDADAQERVWTKMRPEKVVGVNGVYEWVATMDLRVLKQAVKIERSRLRIGRNGSGFDGGEGATA